MRDREGHSPIPSSFLVPTSQSSLPLRGVEESLSPGLSLEAANPTPHRREAEGGIQGGRGSPRLIDLKEEDEFGPEVVVMLSTLN